MRRRQEPNDNDADGAARLERRVWIVFALVFLACLPVALVRVHLDEAGTDFPEFHAAGRYVMEHGARHPDTILHRYLPSVDVAWVLLALLPRMAAATVWYGVGCLTWAALVAAIARYLLPEHEPPVARLIALTAAGLTLVPFLDHLFLGAFHVLMLWLMLAGLSRVMRGRHVSGAALLGIAIWLKVLPVVGAGYLVLKRKWGPALGCVLVAGAIDVGLTVAGYGAAEGWSLHVRWARSRAVGEVHALLQAPGYLSEQRGRNQASAAVLRRILTQAGMEGRDAADRRVAVADLTSGQLRAVYFLGLGLLGAAVAWFCREPANRVSESRWTAEIALVVLTTLWISPMTLSYHPVAAMPALAVIVGRRGLSDRLARAAVVVAVLAMLLLGWPLARAAGEYLWASLLLGAGLVLTGVRRDPLN